MKTHEEDKDQKKTDYEDLEGITISCNFFGEEFDGYVAGIASGLGFTIVDADDKERYLACLLGPSSPLWPKSAGKAEEDMFELMFAEVVRQLRKGFYNTETVRNVLKPIQTSVNLRRRLGYSPSSDTCTFSQ